MPYDLSQGEREFNFYMHSVGGVVWTPLFSLKADGGDGRDAYCVETSSVVCLTCWMRREAPWSLDGRDARQAGLIKYHQSLGHEVSFEPAKSLG